MKIKFKKFLRIFFICYLPLAICQMLSGCATAPVKESVVTYNLNGAVYFPLIPLCEARGIVYQYDSFSKVVSLNREQHKVSFRVGDNLVLVDGRSTHFKDPIDIYQGAIVVPKGFKEQVLDQVFKKTYAASRAFNISYKIKKVVIDPGHGGNDPGAIGRTGLREKDVNLDIAKRLARMLKSAGVEVVMTRNSDRFIPLPTRVEIANRSRADLFISIHSNANRVRSLKGFEVYYVAPNVSDSKRAASQGMPLELANASFANHSADLKAIVWDMIYTNSRAEAIELSRSICRYADDNLNVSILGVKGARYQVLRGTTMPAVLVEVGFLSNSNEERMLKNGYYREKIAQSLVEGIGEYAKNCQLTEAAKR